VPSGTVAGKLYNRAEGNIMTGVIVRNRQTVFKAGVFKLETEEITLENGVDTHVHILRHPGAAAIVPMLDAGTVVLIRQYRHAMGGFVWEVPAGTLDGADADPLACAQRELVEETGYRGDHFEKLGVIAPSPGYSDERIHIFLATGLTLDRQNLDRDEVLHVHAKPFDEAMKMAGNGEIVDAKTIAALFLAKSHCFTQNPPGAAQR